MNFNENNMRPIIQKKSRLEPHAELFGAFAHNDTLTLTLLLPSSYRAENVVVELWLDDSMTRAAYPVVSAGNEGEYDRFEYTFDFESLCGENDNGLFYYHFSFESAGERFYVSRNKTDLLPDIVGADDEVSSYQLTVYAESFATPSAFKGKIMYQIFVDRFAKDDKTVPVRSDAVINEDWENGVPEYPEYPGGFVKNNMFFGGTLWGIIEKLTYLKELGVGVIYLNPIFEAYSNHKYDTGNYMRVDEMFGGDEAFDALIREAGKLGIGVILDGVFNHTGSDSIYFNKNGRYNSVGAYNSKKSEYYDWFMFTDYPDKYESWWGIEILPKLNGKNKALREFICGENGVIRHYLRRGAYGWRLDVADELDEELLAGIREAAKAEFDAPIIGEVWEDASNKVAYDRRRRYFRGHELDSVMNYPLRRAVIDYLLKGDASELARVTTELYMHYPKAVSDVLMNFLGTHDTERILTVLSGEDVSSKSNAELAEYKMNEDQRITAVKLLKLAYLIVATMPGVPCIYYGDEAGVEGGRDPFNRKPYPWGHENKELVSWYKELGSVRTREPIFESGYYKVLEVKNGIFSYKRFDDKGEIVIIVNRTEHEYTALVAGISLLTGENGNRYRQSHTVKPMSAEIIKT